MRANYLTKGRDGLFSGLRAGLLIAGATFFIEPVFAQGTWALVKSMSPDPSGGVMLLLSDGSVMAHTTAGGTPAGYGNIWNRLTPDAHGSYVNGTWSKISAPMNNTRIGFGSCVLKDGRVFVVGGEYGSGIYTAETYDPLNNTWTLASVPANVKFSDASSEVLENGQVLIGPAVNTNSYLFDPVNNTVTKGPAFVNGGNSIGAVNLSDESAWVKLPDNTILFVNIDSKKSERYIPSKNLWVNDADAPVMLYDSQLYETGPSFMLPNGKAFFIGSTSTTAIYTPSGSGSPGAWVAGPAIPKNLGQPDANSAMMANGKILCAMAATPGSGQPYPTHFYEYDYINNSFTQVTAPGGDTIMNVGVSSMNMLDLPDGTVMLSNTHTTQYYIYKPNGAPLSSGKPTINQVTEKSCNSYLITGTQFNGISEGAVFGDDWQMATNYPLVRLTSGTNVYYARTFNWNSAGVQRGALPDTTQFTLPSGLPYGDYSLEVVANGIASDPVSFNYSVCTGIEEANGNLSEGSVSVYPNPSGKQFTISFNLKEAGNYNLIITDILGRVVLRESGQAYSGNNLREVNTTGLATGAYSCVIQTGNEILKTKLLMKGTY